MKNNLRYRMSFTTGGLFLNESIKIAKEYLKNNSWEVTKERVLNENLLQYSSKGSIIRVYHEIEIRLRSLSHKLLLRLASNDRKEQEFIIWIAVCKTYRFIGDFAIKVIREKFLLMNYNLTHEDYMRFFNSIADWYPELDDLSEKTVQKQKQVIFKMLKEAEIISSDNMVIPAVPTADLLRTLYEDDPKNVTYLPISDTNIQELLNND